MQHIFVDGPDGGGKSTLVQRLQYDLWTFGVHTGGPPRTKDEMATRFEQLRYMTSPGPWMTRGLVFDRCPFICEVVYPAVVGREAYFTRSYCLHLAAASGAVFVYCRRPIEDMKASIVMSHKGHKPKEHTDRVLASYDRLVAAYDEAFAFLEERGGRVIRYNWADDSYDTLKTELLACVA